MKKICAIIVTYNRKKYLINLIDKLINQDCKIDTILIYDNFSSDNTGDFLINKGIIKHFIELEATTNIYLDTNIIYYRNNFNSGGAGGFHEAMKLAMQSEFDYLWCMDDDVLPEKDCLSIMLDSLNSEIKMAIPSRNDSNFIDKPIIKVDLSNPFKFKSIKKGIDPTTLKKDIIEVVDVAFEGPLISTELIKKIGYMDKNYFIFFDDTDFSYRASKYTKINYCLKATLHKQIIPIVTKNREYNWRDYYMIRNRIWFDMQNGENYFVKNLRPILFKYALLIKATIQKNPKNKYIIKKSFYDAKNHNMGKTIDPMKDVIYETKFKNR
ncbi:glycosyltransferase [Turicibacter sanguinis]|uniref:glycosyltransferase n=1 Tax=Turicibacter sanguinis TaxID=154288 RepID=UPI001899402B|nr:glycosyltransferase [Turicibacter sanguinis]